VTKKQNTRLVWILVWAGLLIVVLYSPIGSPDYYSSNGNYYVVNQPVTLSSGTTLNAPKANSSDAGTSDELIIPEVSLTSKTNAGGGRYSSGNASSVGSSYGNMSSPSYQNSNSTSGRMSGGGSLIASGGSRSSAGSSEITMTNGITTMSLTSTGSNTPPKQNAGESVLGDVGGTDPGPDPTGDTIPVGEGWGIFIFCGISYLIYKMRLILKGSSSCYSSKSNKSFNFFKDHNR